MTAKRKPADLAPLKGAGLGRVAYEAYCACVGGKSPTWGDLVEKDHDTAAAWCAAGRAARGATIRKD